MINIIIGNIITSIIIIIYGSRIGERGGMKIIERIMIINIICIIYYIYKIIILGEERIEYIGIWIEEISREISNSIIIDKKSIIMISLITIIGNIVIYYSKWYMGKDIVFKGYLLLFQVTMTILVSSKTLIGIYIGWEWVGIMSYILISNWYRNIMNIKSGIKAIVYNKIGDIGYILLLNHILYNNNLPTFNILSYNSIQLSYIDNILYNILPIYIMIASMAKSAQYILHPWLGDAMAGPTPVSALLHAATMVTAGIVLINRTIIYNSNIWEYIMIIGIITIIFGGLSGISQNDIKKIIAYSTCSQLGYMYLISIYPNIPNDISLYHLYIHGFFKALLFIGAGIIIHNNGNEQDIRRLNLNINNNPISYIFLLFSSLSLLAIPYTSGYYSKEIIIYSITNKEVYICSIIGAILTTFYSIKLLYKSYILNTTIKNTYKEHIDYNTISILSLLLTGSIDLGIYTYNVFIGEIVYSIDSIRRMSSIPLYLTLIIIILYLIYNIYITINIWEYREISNIIYEIINRRTYIDSIFNHIADSFLSYSYLSLYKDIDKGILELIGPIGIYRSLNRISPSYSTINIFTLIPSFLFFILILLYI